MFYVSSMVITKKILIKDTQKEIRKESKHVTAKKKKNQWNIKENSKKCKRDKEVTRQKAITINKMTIVSPSWSVITLTVNGLKSAIKI